jgi:Ca2+-binding RTX toxin-like protein
LGDGGNDFLGGSAAADLILGGWGDDVIFGADGPDWLEGNDGDDFLLSRDGSMDVVAGGFGRDRGSTDRFDTIWGIERFLA